MLCGGVLEAATAVSAGRILGKRRGATAEEGIIAH